MVLVNAEGKVLGRLSTFCAKKALEGEQVTVVNAEKAIMTGSKKDRLARFKRRMDLAAKGNPNKGPKASRMPDRMLRHAINGMLPHKKKAGREAIKRVIVFIGMPEKFNGKEFAEIKEDKESSRINFITLGEISRLLGAKW